MRINAKYLVFDERNHERINVDFRSKKMRLYYKKLPIIFKFPNKKQVRLDGIKGLSKKQIQNVLKGIPKIFILKF